MLREAHRSQFDPALEVAGSGLDERPSGPLRVIRVDFGMSAARPVRGGRLNRSTQHKR
jgi:hypothetical protein